MEIVQDRIYQNTVFLGINLAVLPAVMTSTGEMHVLYIVWLSLFPQFPIYILCPFKSSDSLDEAVMLRLMPK